MNMSKETVAALIAAGATVAAVGIYYHNRKIKQRGNKALVNYSAVAGKLLETTAEELFANSSIGKVEVDKDQAVLDNIENFGIVSNVEGPVTITAVAVPAEEVTFPTAEHAPLRSTPQPSKPVLRVVEQKTTEAPDWWTEFMKRITRPAVSLSAKQLSVGARHDWPQKGYHVCRLNDKVEGILHVTKNHISFVEYMGGGVFMGVSTSEARFGGPGQQPLTEKKARDFLNGR